MRIDCELCVHHFTSNLASAVLGFCIFLDSRLIAILAVGPDCAGDTDLATQPPQECNSEQAAATILGFTQASWDNESGNEEQPSSADKGWDELTEREKAAALVLGYTRRMWESGTTQPASMEKDWAELTSCGDVY